MNSPTKNKNLIKTTATRLGFDYCGIAKAVKLEDDAIRLENWLAKKMHGAMHYMENHFDLRIDPCKLVHGARSVITLLKNYFPSEHQKDAAPKISKYAYGKDYHAVIRQKLHELLDTIKSEIGNIT